MELTKLLQQLTGAFGPSGCETEIRETIAGLVRPYVDEVRTDAMGNLICHKKGPGRKLMFSAHMDSVGMMVTYIEREGCLRFGHLGGLSLGELRGQAVRFANGTRGVIVVSEEKEGEEPLKKSDVLIDIGAADRAQAQTMVRVGDACVYDASFRVQGDTILSGTLDDRAGCAVLIRAMERITQPKNDLYFVFSVQEELGCRGAKPAAFGIDPDLGIAVDVTGSADCPGSTHQCPCVLGGGAGIKVMDHSVICQPGLVAWMSRVAEERGIPAQRDVLRVGGTDAGAIQPTRAGVYAGGIDIPCRYVHSPVELCSVKDLEACADLAAALAESEFEEA